MSLLDRWLASRRFPDAGAAPRHPRPPGWARARLENPGEVGPDGLTDRQREVFRFLYETTRETGVQPTFREVCGRLDINSPNGAAVHFRALVRKGWLRQGRYRSRSLTFLRRPDGAPFTGFADKP